MTVLASLAAAAALVALPALPSAAELAVVAVTDSGEPSRVLLELAVRLRAALAEQTPGVLEPGALRLRMSARPDPAALEAADRAFADSVAAHSAGRFEEAQSALRAQVDRLVQLVPDPAVRSRLARATLRLARAEQVAGHPDQAAAALDRLLQADPEAPASARDFPPSFLRLVDEARARAAPGRVRRLAVGGDPGVAVSVEGRLVGTTPCTVALAPGRYRVTGQVGEARLPPVAVDLTRADAQVALDASLARQLRPDAGPGAVLPWSGRVGRLAALGRLLGVERLVAVSTVESSGARQLLASLHDVGRGAVTREAWTRLTGDHVPAGGLTALASYLLEGKGPPLVEDVTSLGPMPDTTPAAPAPTPPPTAAGAQAPDLRPLPPATPPIAAAPPATAAPSSTTAVAPASGALGWTSLVTGVAALTLGGIATYQGIQATHDYQRARDLLNPERTGVRAPYTVAQYNDLVRSADRARASAIGTGAGAGAALLGTGVLCWLSWRQTGTCGPIRF